MSPTMRYLVIPVSNLQAAQTIDAPLLGAAQTDESYHVGYNIDAF